MEAPDTWGPGASMCLACLGTPPEAFEVLTPAHTFLPPPFAGIFVYRKQKTAEKHRL
jgi:hypothetical protein